MSRTTEAARVGAAWCTTASGERNTQWSAFAPSILTPVSSEAPSAACQGRNSAPLPALEPPLCAPQQVHEATLAELQPEQVGQGALRPLIRQRLEGLEVRGERMRAR